MSHTNVKNVIKGLGGDPIWFLLLLVHTLNVLSMNLHLQIIHSSCQDGEQTRAQCDLRLLHNLSEVSPHSHDQHQFCNTGSPEYYEYLIHMISIDCAKPDPRILDDSSWQGSQGTWVCLWVASQLHWYCIRYLLAIIIKGDYYQGTQVCDTLELLSVLHRYCIRYL